MLNHLCALRTCLSCELGFIFRMCAVCVYVCVCLWQHITKEYMIRVSGMCLFVLTSLNILLISRLCVCVCMCVYVCVYECVCVYVVFQ